MFDLAAHVNKALTKAIVLAYAHVVHVSSRASAAGG